MISERGHGPNGWGNFPLFVKRNEKHFHVVNLLFSSVGFKTWKWLFVSGSLLAGSVISESGLKHDFEQRSIEH